MAAREEGAEKKEEEGEAMDAARVVQTELVLTGEREMVEDAARVQELLAAATVEGGEGLAEVQRVQLSGKSLSPQAAQAMAVALQQMQSTLRVLDMSDIIAGRPEAEALNTLETLTDALRGTRLVELNVSDNALGYKGVPACRGVLEGQEDLERLYVCNNGMSAAATEAIADFLLFRTATKLRLLHFFNNMSGDGGAAALARIVEQSPDLVDLRFSATRAKAPGCTAFATALASIHGLTNLDLCDTYFSTEEGVDALTAALRAHTQLKRLNLRDASMEADSIGTVCETLADAGCALVALDVSGNEMTADGVEPLCALLQRMPSLETLACDDNELGSDGAAQVAEALGSCPQLQEVKLASNEITTSGAVDVVRAVAPMDHLKSIDLDGNEISDRGLRAIRAILRKNGKDPDAVLQPMENNEEPGEDDDDFDGDEGDEEEEGDDAGAAAAAAAASGDGSTGDADADADDGDDKLVGMMSKMSTQDG